MSIIVLLAFSVAAVTPEFALVPMVFMFAVTLNALVVFAWRNLMAEAYLLSVLATLLFALAVVLILLARRSLKSMTQGTPPVEVQQQA